MRMELRLLRYFVAIAEERHFGRAAARLHMTQPPLSRAIKQLETDLGVVLLHRSATGVELPPPGNVLYVEAPTLLEQAGQTPARATATTAAAPPYAWPTAPTVPGSSCQKARTRSGAPTGTGRRPSASGMVERHDRHRAAHPRPARWADLGAPDRHAPELSRCRLGDRE